MPAGDTAVIQRKLAIPEVSERALGRPRLERLLAMLVERYPVVWVAATAGAGKTTAVVQAARAIERPVAWLTLDATDAAPGRLVTYLEAALTRCSPQVRGVGTGALARRIAHAEAAGLLAEAVGKSPVLLVIDELERLAEAPEALAALGGLLRYAPPSMRIVLISRHARPRRSGRRGRPGLHHRGGSASAGGRRPRRGRSDRRRRGHGRLGRRRPLRGVAIGGPRRRPGR